MSDTPETWRQEIELILEEIAADPKARLLRVPSVDNVLSLAQRAPVGTLAPSLTKAERYLLQTHREELAFLLRERCVMEFYADPRADRTFHRSVTVGRDIEIADEGDWSRRARSVVGSNLDEPGCRDVADVLARCTRVRPSAAVNVAHLAAASLRASSSGAARFFLGAQLVSEQRSREARKIYEAVLSAAESPLLESLCWEGIGFTYYLGGRYRDAAVAYCKSTESDSARVSAPLFWYVSAVLAGDQSRDRAALIVETVVPVGHHIVNWVVNALTAEVRFSSDAERQVRSPTSPDARGEVTARVLDAIRS